MPAIPSPESTDIATVRKTARISLRTSRDVKELIEQAAASQCCSLSGFILERCIEEARRIVDAAARLEFSETTNQQQT